MDGTVESQGDAGRAAPDLSRLEAQLLADGAAPHLADTPPEHAPRPTKPSPRVPWGLRETLLGLVVAQFPQFVPVVLVLIAGAGAAAAPTTSRAVATVVGTILYDGWWIVWAWVFSLRKFGLKLSAWGFCRPRLSIIWIVPLVVIASLTMELIYGRWVHVPQEAVASRFPHTLTGLILFAVGACVLAPLCEETFFRGFLFPGFASWRGPVWGAIISSALWSAGHRELALFVPFFLIGLLLCWAYRRGGSIWTTIAIHAIMNTIAVLSWSALGGR